jgi:hypothetical protein
MIAYWERDSEWMGEGLVGAWCPSFTGATGLQLADISGQANHGVLTGMDPGTDWVASGGKGALDFDGTDDYVVVPYSSSLSVSQLTLAIWINRRAAQSFGHPICKPFSDTAWTGSFVEYAFEYNGTSTFLQFILGHAGGYNVIQVNTVGDNAWFHAAATYDGSTARLYLD